MSGIFKDAKQAEDVNEATESVGGGGFIVDSGVQEYTIEEAFAHANAKTGSQAITFHLKGADGALVRNTQYWQSGKSKGNKTYYEKDGEKYPLPGFTICDNICQLAAERELHEMDTTERTIQLYDFDAKEEVATKVESLEAIRNKKVQLAILRTLSDKNKQGDDGEWYPVGTREVNEIDRVFAAISGYEGLSLKEIQSGAEEPTIKPKWLAKWEGKVKDTASDEGKAAQAEAGNSAQTGSSKPAGAPAAAGKKSLFAKK